MYNTYSFDDVSATFSHPAVGLLQIGGEASGVGSIGINFTTDVTAHDIAADGTVMISKIKASNGTIALVCQQNSAINRFLTRWYNYIRQADSGQWAGAILALRDSVGGDSYVCTGVSPQKLADRSYQAQGQQVTWNLMAADIQYN